MSVDLDVEGAKNLTWDCFYMQILHSFVKIEVQFDFLVFINNLPVLQLIKDKIHIRLVLQMT